MKLTGQKDDPSIQSLFEQCTLKAVKRILSAPSHVLHYCYELLPSGRRFRTLRCTSNRFKNVSIRLLNLIVYMDVYVYDV